MKYTLATTLMMLAATALAQSEFRPGYYVTQAGDTIQGWIDYRGDVFNAYHCNFKSNGSDKVSEFLPGAIREYRLTDGKLYVSKTVTLEKFGKNKVVLGELESGELQVTPAEKETIDVFLECLVRGELSTYFLRTRDGIEYFFAEEKNGAIQTLDNNDVVYKSSDGNIRLKPTNQYIGALSFLAKDYPELRSEANKLAYNRKEIIDFSKKYHQEVCTTGEHCIVYEKKQVRSKVLYGVFFKGGNYSTRYVSPTLTFDGRAASWGAGGSVDVQLLNTSERIFFNARLEFDKISMSGDYDVPYNNFIHEYTCDIAALRLSPSLMYIYPPYAFKPLVFAGGFVERLAFSGWKQDDQSISDEELMGNEVNYGFIVGTGVQYKNHLRLSLALDITPERGSLVYFSRTGIEYALYYVF